MAGAMLFRQQFEMLFPRPSGDIQASLTAQRFIRCTSEMPILALAVMLNLLTLQLLVARPDLHALLLLAPNIALLLAIYAFATWRSRRTQPLTLENKHAMIATVGHWVIAFTFFSLLWGLIVSYSIDIQPEKFIHLMVLLAISTLVAVHCCAFLPKVAVPVLLIGVSVPAILISGAGAAGCALSIGLLVAAAFQFRLIQQQYQQMLDLLNTEKRAERLGQTDALTGIVNRCAFFARLEDHACADQPFALVLIDLDQFKQINVHLGQRHGDLVLQALARRLSPLARFSDTFGRIGGDDFAFLLRSAATRPRLEAFCEQLREAIVQPCVTPRGPVVLSASVGIALFPMQADAGAVLYARAEAALASAKSQRPPTRPESEWLSPMDSQGEVRFGRLD